MGAPDPPPVSVPHRVTHAVTSAAFSTTPWLDDLAHDRSIANPTLSLSLDLRRVRVVGCHRGVNVPSMAAQTHGPPCTVHQRPACMWTVLTAAASECTGSLRRNLVGHRSSGKSRLSSRSRRLVSCFTYESPARIKGGQRTSG